MRNSLTRVQTLRRLDEILLEFLHHGAGGFHAVDRTRGPTRRSRPSAAAAPSIPNMSQTGDFMMCSFPAAVFLMLLVVGLKVPRQQTRKRLDE
jgi:hypothetical protein